MISALLSDLHFEMHRDGGASFVAALDPSGVDVLVLAGDVCSAADPDSVESLVAMAARYPRTLFVPGNHEYYGSSVESAERVLAGLESRAPGLSVLRAGAAVEVGGRRFLGGTLWFPDDAGNATHEHALNDFRMIRGLVPWCHDRNAELRAWLQSEIREGDVVVTHHLPSHRSVPPRFRGSELNRFFVSDEEETIRLRRPAIWMHGHTHDPCDWSLGPTRVLCNPFGYPREGKAGFREKLLIPL